MYKPKPETYEEKQDYIIGLKPTWRYKVYSMPEYQVNAVFNKLWNEELQKEIQARIELYSSNRNQG